MAFNAPITHKHPGMRLFWYKHQSSRSGRKPHACEVNRWPRGQKACKLIELSASPKLDSTTVGLHVESAMYDHIVNALIAANTHTHTKYWWNYTYAGSSAKKTHIYSICIAYKAFYLKLFMLLGYILAVFKGHDFRVQGLVLWVVVALLHLGELWWANATLNFGNVTKDKEYAFEV